jgi:hypothetical protein
VIAFRPSRSTSALQASARDPAAFADFYGRRRRFFTADTVALYSFEHPSWTGAWWVDLGWEYWRLRAPGPD